MSDVAFWQGNTALAHGAILAGCDFFGGYPITPSTEIAEAMAEEGAFITVADLNLKGAEAFAAELNDLHGADTAIAVEVDVSDEISVERMIQQTVLVFGGLDVLVSNAGILIAGSLSDLSKEKFDMVTKVNYSGYFLCSKYAAEPMKLQKNTLRAI